MDNWDGVPSASLGDYLQEPHPQPQTFWALSLLPPSSSVPRNQWAWHPGPWPLSRLAALHCCPGRCVVLPRGAVCSVWGETSERFYKRKAVSRLQACQQTACPLPGSQSGVGEGALWEDPWLPQICPTPCPQGRCSWCQEAQQHPQECRVLGIDQDSAPLLHPALLLTLSS